MNKKANYGLFIDFGSTFTKLVSIDFDRECIVGRAQGPSTVDTDITRGLNAALENLNRAQGGEMTYRYRLACSSAAGGLRMVTIGLVPELTVEAAKRAALGAGARPVGVYSYKLTKTELGELETLAPDILLLAGGTDGGDQETILHNATGISQGSLQAPIIVAGNKVASDRIRTILDSGNKECIITENVMPEIGVLQVDKARSIIRDVFINRIVEAKGLKRAEQFVDGILMPTPTAALTAARLLSQGTGNEEGLGELVVVDIGGATSDIHSIARGESTEPGLVKKGLPEPFVKRTVEGDLGVRHNAASILHAAGKEHFEKGMGDSDIELDEAIDRLSLFPDHLPETESERDLDTELARAAARMAMQRHAGTIQTTYGPEGRVFIQYGKDLRDIKSVIGTGGPLIFGTNPEKILKETTYSQTDPFSLRPKAPDLYLDERYLLYAIGLMSEVEPDKAIRIAKKYIRKL